MTEFPLPLGPLSSDTAIHITEITPHEDKYTVTLNDEVRMVYVDVTHEIIQDLMCIRGHSLEDLLSEILAGEFHHTPMESSIK
jgi:hypothetical protein